MERELKGESLCQEVTKAVRYQISMEIEKGEKYSETTVFKRLNLQTIRFLKRISNSELLRLLKDNSVAEHNSAFVCSC